MNLEFRIENLEMKGTTPLLPLIHHSQFTIHNLAGRMQ